MSASWPGESVKVSGHPCRSQTRWIQTRWILVVKPPRLRPNAWSTGSSGPPFCRLPRRPAWHERPWSRSSRYPGPSSHPRAISVGGAPVRRRRCHHHATGGIGHTPWSRGHSAPASRAIWPPSTGPRRCRSRPGDHPALAAPSSEAARRCP